MAFPIPIHVCLHKMQMHMMQTQRQLMLMRCA